jgi:catechol 2,3-dioxygenase-like lactoylglutathione lyase family enzyme
MSSHEEETGSGVSKAPTSSAITGVRTVGIPVADQDRALAFFTGTLGFETRLDLPLGGGSRWIEVAPAGATVSLALERSHDGHPAGVETGVRLTALDVDATHAALRAAGVDADDVLRWPGVPPMFAFRDQDGNGLEIVEA